MITPIFLSIIVPGTLAANITYRFTAPCDLTLNRVSASAENDSDATLIVGPSTDTDGYLEASVIGDSSVPVEYDRDDFASGKDTQIRKGIIVVFTLDFDGAGGTAAQNVSILATFTPG